MISLLNTACKENVTLLRRNERPFTGAKIVDRWTWCRKAIVSTTLSTNVITLRGSRTCRQVAEQPTRRTVTDIARLRLRLLTTHRTDRSAVACIVHATVVACHQPLPNIRSAGLSSFHSAQICAVTLSIKFTQSLNSKVWLYVGICLYHRLLLLLSLLYEQYD